MKKALTEYATGNDGTEYPAKDIDQLIGYIDETIVEADEFLLAQGINLGKIIEDSTMFDKLDDLRTAYVAESKNINQLDFMYELFKDFIESDEGADFDFDNGLVCRWLNGTARISARITSYYSELGNIEAMAID